MIVYCHHCEKTAITVRDHLVYGPEIYWCFECLPKDFDLLNAVLSCGYNKESVERLVNSASSIRYLGWWGKFYYEKLIKIPKIKRYRIRRLKCLKKD